MTRSGGKAGPVPDNGTVDGAPGGRRVLSPEDSRVSPDARRVRTTPAKESLTSPLAPSRRSIPLWGIRKKEAGAPGAFKNTGDDACAHDGRREIIAPC